MENIRILGRFDEETGDEYSIYAECINCGAEDIEISITKGCPVVPLLDSVLCPTCSCLTFLRVTKEE